MKSRIVAALTVLAPLLVMGPLAASAADGAGHCNYVQKNMFAGPFKVCDMPSSAEKCTEAGKSDENSNAVHGDGDCSTAGKVGMCDMGEAGKRIYYEGDPGGLEIGCGFQGGEWKAG
jgi:hypothetical protein